MALIPLGVAGLLVAAVVAGRLSRVPEAGGGSIALSRDGVWDRVCISSQHQYPDGYIQRYGGAACWAREVPPGQIYLSFLRTDGGCERLVVRGFLLAPNLSETRCLSRSEVEGWGLVGTGGVYAIERLEAGGG